MATEATDEQLPARRGYQQTHLNLSGEEGGSVRDILSSYG